MGEHNGHSRQSLTSVLGQAVPGGVVVRQKQDAPPAPDQIPAVSGLAAGPPVEWAVLQELRDAVSDDVIAEEKKRPLATEEDRRELTRSLVRKRVARWAAAHARTAPALSEAEEEAVRQAVYDAIYHAGPLQRLLDDPQVENIVVLGSEVTVDRVGQPTTTHPPVADSNEKLVELINTLAARSGNRERQLSPATPMVNFRLPGGERAAATLLTQAPFLGIRRHRVITTTLEDLEHMGTVSPCLRAFLHAAVLARQTLLIAGEMGSGKTTLLRALARLIGPEERVTTLETDRELYLEESPPGHGPQVLAMEERLSNGEVGTDGRPLGQVTVGDMIPFTLRMLSTRVIVGEVRSSEAVPMLDAMSAGGRGSLCTLHASYPHLVMPRLTQLCRTQGLDTEAVHEMVANAVHYIVYIRQAQRRGSGQRGLRYVSHVYEVSPGERGRVALNEVFGPAEGSHDPRAVPKVPPSQMTFEELEAAGFRREWLHPGHGGWPTPWEAAR